MLARIRSVQSTARIQGTRSIRMIRVRVCYVTLGLKSREMMYLGMYRVEG